MNILIPIKNDSQRLPEKDFFLLPFTLQWLEKEFAALPESMPLHVYTYGWLDDAHLDYLERILPKSICGHPVRHLQLTKDEDSSHYQATASVIEKLGESAFYIMCQVTQPKRRAGLLQGVIDHLQDDCTKPVISCSKIDVQGRLIDGAGRIADNQPNAVYLHDGAVYGFCGRGVADVFRIESGAVACNRVINDVVRVCDIDGLADLRAHVRFD